MAPKNCHSEKGFIGMTMEHDEGNLQSHKNSTAFFQTIHHEFITIVLTNTSTISSAISHEWVQSLVYTKERKIYYSRLLDK